MASAHFRSLPVEIVNRARPLVSGLSSGLRYAREHVGNMKAMSCGLMLGSSALVPIICSPALSLGDYLRPDLGTFIVSTACYGVLNREHVIENSPIVLGLYSAAGLLVFLSPRPLLHELPPWIPLCMAMNLLLSVSVVPWIKSARQPERATTLRQHLLANGDDRPEGSRAGTIDPDSSQSNGTSNGHTRSPFRSITNPLDFAHFGHMGQDIPRNSEDETSDIDLEEGLHRQFGSSHGSEGSEEPLL